MPTLTKKTLAITPTEKPSRPKKKKKKLVGRSSKNTRSKTPASGVDSSSEGNQGVIKSRLKSRGGELTTSDERTSESHTQNTSSSWRISSSDGRSTSCSGENFSSASCAKKSASLDDSRVRGSADSLAQSSSTSLTRENETLRWDYIQCDDPKEEEERLRIYKLHRRKRYMDFLHKRTGGEPQSNFYA